VAEAGDERVTRGRPGIKREKIGGAVKSVDSVDISEIVWCDHVRAFGDYLAAATPTFMLPGQQAVIGVFEEGKLKLLCMNCTQEGLAKRLRKNLHSKDA
jgi:hypothetical protein